MQWIKYIQNDAPCWWQITPSQVWGTQYSFLFLYLFIVKGKIGSLELVHTQSQTM